jgi:putative transposase
MSQPTTTKYPAEFKERAVKLAVESEQPIAQTARDLGVNENTLHTWIGKYHRAERQEKEGNDEHLYEELKRLRKENARLKEEREILIKKGGGVLCATAAVKYAWMHQQQAEFPVSRLCRTLAVSRSGYYEWLGRPPSTQAADQQLQEKVQRYFTQGRGTYGTRRIKHLLAQEGLQVSRRRIGRVLAQAGLRCKTRRRCKAPIAAGQAQTVAPNQLNREFTVKEPDTVYVGDITYLPTGEGWLYLAVVLDLCSRAVVGWSMADHMRAELVNQALAMAIYQRRPATGLIMHTDRGSQYGADSYQQLLVQHGIQPSMSRKGNCWDNAVAESFFHTLKTELTYLEDFDTREQAQTVVFEYIEVFYNRQRCHSANGYLAPLAYEQVLQTNGIFCPEKC